MSSNISGDSIRFPKRAFLGFEYRDLMLYSTIRRMANHFIPRNEEFTFPKGDFLAKSLESLELAASKVGTSRGIPLYLAAMRAL